MSSLFDPFGVQDSWGSSSNFKKFNATLGPVENMLSDSVETRLSDPTKAGPAAANPGVSGNISQINPEWAKANPDEAQALITQQQSDYARNTFLPIEEQLAGTVSRSTEAEATRAGGMSRKAFEQSRKTFGRDLSRRGLSLNTAQSSAIARRSAIAESKGVATAKNLTRRTLDDRNRELQGNLAGLGKGIASSARDAFDVSANAQAQREGLGRSLNQQQQQSQMGGAASGAAMGYQAGGGWGALAGGLIGYASGS